MSNPFEIAANATSRFASIPTVPAVPPIRPGPKLKPLVERKSLHALQLAQHKSSPISVTAEGLFTRFKTSRDDESDSDSSTSTDKRRRSYTREQKLAAIGYATTKKVWSEEKQQMVLISQTSLQRFGYTSTTSQIEKGC